MIRFIKIERKIFERMKLFRTLRFAFSGGQTNFLELKMLKFRPIDEYNIFETLTELYARRVTNQPLFDRNICLFIRLHFRYSYQRLKDTT